LIARWGNVDLVSAGSYLKTCSRMEVHGRFDAPRDFGRLWKRSYAHGNSNITPPDSRQQLPRSPGHARTRGLSIEVIPSHIDEPTGQGFTDPRHYVMSVAWLKAAAVAPQVKDGLILAADTVGWLGRPGHRQTSGRHDARRILTALSGREHELWTGVVLWRKPDNVQLLWQECTRLFFRVLSEKELTTISPPTPGSADRAPTPSRRRMIRS